MNEKDMNVFEDEEIVEMYKANVQTAGPDMEKLWNRIESAVDASERNEETLKREKIKSSGRNNIMRFVVTAAALAVVAYAGVKIYNSRIEKDNGGSTGISEFEKDNTLNNGSSEKKGVNTADNESPEHSVNAAEKTAPKEENKENASIDNDNTDTQNGLTKSSDTKNDPFLLDSSEKVVLVKIVKMSAENKAYGWFVDDLGSVYTFSGVDASEKNKVYEVLETLTEKQDPVYSVGEDTLRKITKLAGDVKNTSYTGENRFYAHSHGKSVSVSSLDKGKAATELLAVADKIEKQIPETEDR